jgi:multidrug resistance protein, MATE family
MTALSPAEPFAVTHRGVFAIALPMTLAYLTTPLVGIVSLGVVGRLGDPALVGGVSIGGVIFDIVFLTFNFLRAGTTGLVAQALGAGDRRAIAATLYRALILAIGFGLAVIVLQVPIVTIAQQLIGGSDAVKAATRTYWDVRVLAAPVALANYVVLGWLIGLGRAGFGLCLQIVLNGINIVLGIVLVHGLGFGVAGVGWASVAAEASAAALGLVFILVLTGRADRPRFAEVFNGAAFGRLIALNRDIMIRTFALLLAFAVFTSRSAAAGDVVLAANEILMNLIVFAAFFLDGLAAAAEQLAGRAIGARYRPSFERAVRLTVFWGFAVGAVLTAVMLVAGGAIVDLMSTSVAVRAAARNVLIWASLFPLFGTLAYQMDGVFIGATWSVDMRNAMLVSLAVYLVAGWLLAKPLGITGWWIALLVFLATRGLTLLWRSRVRIGPAFADQPAGPAP